MRLLTLEFKSDITTKSEAINILLISIFPLRMKSFDFDSYKINGNVFFHLQEKIMRIKILVSDPLVYPLALFVARKN